MNEEVLLAPHGVNLSQGRVVAQQSGQEQLPSPPLYTYPFSRIHDPKLERRVFRRSPSNIKAFWGPNKRWVMKTTPHPVTKMPTD